VETRTVRQTFTTTGNLGNIYLPVAFELAEVIDSGTIDLEYEAESGAMVVTRESYPDSLDGFGYTIESAVPIQDGPSLRTSTTDSLGSGFLDQYTQLPGDFPASIRAEAERVTADATTDYDRAIALQDHLRTNLDYNIDVALQQNVDDLEAFLFEAQEGYCVQFASAFAAMARSIGIPTRLVVGFTWGEWDETRREYVVRGEHAHAWPEVYFADHGWINFEPTPGRGAPNAAAVTGHEPQQAGTDAAPPSTSVPASGSTPSGSPPTFEDFVDPTTGLPATTPSDGSFPYSTVALVISVVAAIVAIVPGLRFLQRRQRMTRAAHDSRARVELAWDDALQALELIDVRYQPQETPTEFADRIGTRRRDLGPIGALAETTTVARYAPEIDDDQVRVAEVSSGEIRSLCHSKTASRRRAAAWFDPRPLVKR
jgi:transglutaminase-like putative cysteine protease